MSSAASGGAALVRGIQRIDQSSVHRICSGQVVLDPSSALKELVENSVDAGASKVEVRLKEYGLESLEVVDDGSGIKPEDYELLANKHTTSKLSTFEDLSRVSTFGFRGEALSSLCAICEKVHIVTRTSEQAVGTKLEYDRNGILTSTTNCARDVGTTVTLTGLFHNLPVRLKDFQKNKTREFQRLLRKLQAYAIIHCDVRITCKNQTPKANSAILSTAGNKKLLDSVTSVFGAKIKDSLTELSLACSEDVSVQGLISKCSPGCGLSSGDRQFLFLNKRPVDVPKLTKAMNEVYKSYNMHQFPMYFLNISMATTAYDVNVTPDKRTVMFHDEKKMVESIKELLKEFYEPTRGTMSIQSFTSPKSTTSDTTDPTVSAESSQEQPRGKSTSIAKRQNEEEGGSQALDGSEREGEPSPSTPSNVTATCEPVVCKLDDLRSTTPRTQSSADRPDRPQVPALKNATGSMKLTQSLLPSTEKRRTPGKGSASGRAASDSEDSTGAAPSKSDQAKAMDRDGSDEKQLGKRKPQKHEEIDEEIGESEDDEAWSRAVERADVAQERKKRPKISKGDDGSDREVRTPQKQPPQIDVEMPQDGCDTPEVQGGVSMQVNADWKRIIERQRELLSSAAQSEAGAAGAGESSQRGRGGGQATTDAAIELSLRQVAKEDFARMEVLGQFNLGFIIASLGHDMYILDQHACDEKYRYETLQQTTTINSQRLVVPHEMSLEVPDEMVVAENLEIFRTSGFDLEVRPDEPAGSRVRLTAVPFSKGTVFGASDVHEMVCLLRENPGVPCRPSRVSAMFASRACRSAIMIGTALNQQQMGEVKNHMGTMEQPWNCPHGRPTMRHLYDLASVLGQGKRAAAYAYKGPAVVH